LLSWKKKALAQRRGNQKTHDDKPLWCVQLWARSLTLWHFVLFFVVEILIFLHRRTFFCSVVSLLFCRRRYCFGSSFRLFLLLAELLALGGELRLVGGGELVVQRGGRLAAGLDGGARREDRVLLVLDHEDAIRVDRAQEDGREAEHFVGGGFFLEGF